VFFIDSDQRWSNGTGEQHHAVRVHMLVEKIMIMLLGRFPGEDDARGNAGNGHRHRNDIRPKHPLRDHVHSSFISDRNMQQRQPGARAAQWASELAREVELVGAQRMAVKIEIGPLSPPNKSRCQAEWRRLALFATNGAP